MVLSERVAKALFQRRFHNVTNCFPVLYFLHGKIFQDSDKKVRKVFISSKKENHLSIRCCIRCKYCPKIKGKKIKII